MASRTSPATAGWILTEMGRQPWIVQDCSRRPNAVSPNLSTATDRAEPERVPGPLYSRWGSSTFV
jgi:hypothetical protein